MEADERIGRRRNIFALLEQDVDDVERFPNKEKPRSAPLRRKPPTIDKIDFKEDAANLLLLVRSFSLKSSCSGSLYASRNLSALNRKRHISFKSGTLVSTSDLTTRSVNNYDNRSKNMLHPTLKYGRNG